MGVCACNFTMERMDTKNREEVKTNEEIVWGILPFGKYHQSLVDQRINSRNVLIGGGNLYGWIGAEHQIECQWTIENKIEFYLIENPFYNVHSRVHQTPIIEGESTIVRVSTSLTDCLNILKDKGQRFIETRPENEGDLGIYQDNIPVRVMHLSTDQCCVEHIWTGKKITTPMTSLTKIIGSGYFE